MRDESPETPEQRQALNDLFSAAYEELRRLASTILYGERRATLTPTALVNEAWLKLAHAAGFEGLTPLHVKRIIARAMRQVLVDAARRRNADRRGGGVSFVTLDESVAGGTVTSDQVLALDAALQDLAAANPRQASMVEYRFFGGLDVTETAALLGISEATLLRDWRAARAWLAQELRRVS